MTCVLTVYHADTGLTGGDSVTRGNGECVIVAVEGAPTHDHLVTVTEHVPNGYIARHYELEYHTGQITTCPWQTDSVTTGWLHGDRGWTSVYLNRGAFRCNARVLEAGAAF